MATHSSILAWETPCRGAWWAAVHRIAKNRTQLSDLHFHFHTVLQISIDTAWPYKWGSFQGVFQKHSAPWSQGTVEATPVQWGLFHSSSVDLLAALLKLEEFHQGLRRLLLELLRRHDIGGTISPTWLSLSWGDAFAYSFSSLLACMENSGTWIGSTFQVMKREAVTRRRTWQGWRTGVMGLCPDELVLRLYSPHLLGVRESLRGPNWSSRPSPPFGASIPSTLLTHSNLIQMCFQMLKVDDFSRNSIIKFRSSGDKFNCATDFNVMLSASAFLWCCY